MSGPIELNCVIEPFWHVIDRIRNRVDRALAAYGPDVAAPGP